MVEINRDQILNKGQSLIEQGFKGKAIVAFVDMLGFSQEIYANWNQIQFNPLERIMEIKGFMEMAKKGAKVHTFLDYDMRTVLGQIKYPDVITISDSFILIQTLDDEDDVNFILSFLAITVSIIELWRISKDKGFTIRGGVDYGDLFYTQTEVIGPAYIDAYNIESKIADISRIVYSDKIGKLVYLKHNGIHPTLRDYLMRYFKTDIDNRIILNPLIPFGYQNDKMLDLALYNFNDMRNKVKLHSARNKYSSLIDQLYKRDRSLSSIEIFNI